MITENIVNVGEHKYVNYSNNVTVHVSYERHGYMYVKGPQTTTPSGTRQTQSQSRRRAARTVDNRATMSAAAAAAVPAQSRYVCATITSSHDVPMPGWHCFAISSSTRAPVSETASQPQLLHQPAKVNPSYDPQQTWPPPRLRLLTS